MTGRKTITPRELRILKKKGTQVRFDGGASVMGAFLTFLFGLAIIIASAYVESVPGVIVGMVVFAVSWLIGQNNKEPL